MHQLFDWRWTSFSNFQGWMVCMATLLNSIVAAAYLRLIVSAALWGLCTQGCGALKRLPVFCSVRFCLLWPALGLAAVLLPSA